ncbi:hypothetical protein [Scytonema sp. NUACC26]
MNNQVLFEANRSTYISKKLETEYEIRMAQKLIYSVYVEELN